MKRAVKMSTTIVLRTDADYAAWKERLLDNGVPRDVVLAIADGQRCEWINKDPGGDDAVTSYEVTKEI